MEHIMLFSPPSLLWIYFFSHISLALVNICQRRKLSTGRTHTTCWSSTSQNWEICYTTVAKGNRFCFVLVCLSRKLVDSLEKLTNLTNNIKKKARLFPSNIKLSKFTPNLALKPETKHVVCKLVCVLARAWSSHAGANFPLRLREL